MTENKLNDVVVLDGMTQVPSGSRPAGEYGIPPELLEWPEVSPWPRRCAATCVGLARRMVGAVKAIRSAAQRQQ